MKALHKTAIALAAALSLAQAGPTGEWLSPEPIRHTGDRCTQPGGAKTSTCTRTEFAQAIGSAIRGNRAAP